MANVERARRRRSPSSRRSSPAGGSCSRLVFWVGRNITATLRKLQTLSFIHYARWAVIRRFPDGGGGERLRPHLPAVREQLQRHLGPVHRRLLRGRPGPDEGDLGHVVRVPRPDPGRAVQAVHPHERVRRQPLLVGVSRARRRPRSSRPSTSRRRSTSCAGAPTASSPRRSRRRTRRCSPTSRATCEPQRLRPGVRADRAHPDPRRRASALDRAPGRARRRRREPARARARDPLRALGGDRRRRLRGPGQRRRDAAEAAAAAVHEQLRRRRSTPTWRRCAPAWARTPTRSGATARGYPGPRRRRPRSPPTCATTRSRARCSSPPTASRPSTQVTRNLAPRAG